MYLGAFTAGGPRFPIATASALIFALVMTLTAYGFGGNLILASVGAESLDIKVPEHRDSKFTKLLYFLPTPSPPTPPPPPPSPPPPLNRGQMRRYKDHQRRVQLNKMGADAIIKKIPQVYENPESWVVKGTQGMMAYPGMVDDSADGLEPSLGGVVATILQTLLRAVLGV